MTRSSSAMYRHGRGRRVLGLLAGAALVVAACGDDDDGAAVTTTQGGGSGETTTTAGGGSDCVAKAAAFVEPWKELPTELPAAYTKLSKKPEPGVVYKLIDGRIPADNDSFGSQKVAADTIGWDAQAVVFDGTEEDLNEKFFQAIEQAPDDKHVVITSAGFPVASFSQPIKAAEEAGVIVALSSVGDQIPATGTSGFVAGSNGVPASTKIGELNAWKFLDASGCDGNVVIASMPFPSLDVTTDRFTEVVEENCESCNVEMMYVQPADIGTPAIPNAIISQLQADPSIKYVYAIIANVAQGLVPALNQAGIQDIAIFGQEPDEAAVKALQDGEHAWWIGQDPYLNGFTELDSALRVLDTGGPVEIADYPLSIITPENIPKDITAVPTFPLDYRQQFAELWHGDPSVIP